MSILSQTFLIKCQPYQTNSVPNKIDKHLISIPLKDEYPQAEISERLARVAKPLLNELKGNSLGGKPIEAKHSLNFFKKYLMKHMNHLKEKMIT
jgi:hypothetical protein